LQPYSATTLVPQTVANKTKVSTTKLKAKLHRVMMKYHLVASDLELVMRAFGVERLHDLQTARHANFVATLCTCDRDVRPSLQS